MKKSIAAALLVLALIVAGGFFNRERLWLSFLGAKTEKRTLAGQEALIAPFLNVFTPTGGEAPYPVVVQVHGCAGYRDSFMAQWAKVANDLGFLVVGVDSTGPRGIGHDEALSSVCAGKRLIGQERAGDVAAALDLVAARDDVDPARIVAAGWSHGAWSLMDYLSLSGAGLAPAALKGDSAPTDLAGVILFYPYCGKGSWARVEPWKTAATVIAFVGGKDSVVNGPECKARLETLIRKGASIDLIYYPEADHVFDDATLIGGEYEYFYGGEAHVDSAKRYAAFLQGIKSSVGDASSARQ